MDSLRVPRGAPSCHRWIAARRIDSAWKPRRKREEFLRLRSTETFITQKFIAGWTGWWFTMGKYGEMVCNHPHIFWLVVYLPLWKIWKSVGMIIISQLGLWNSQYMENTIHVPNHQPVIYGFGMPNRNIGWCWYNMMYPVYHDGLLLITLIYWKSMVDDGYNENLANSIISSIVYVYMNVNVFW
jgi:hypothetical protein